jgi:hypothetical protein
MGEEEAKRFEKLFLTSLARRQAQPPEHRRRLRRGGRGDQQYIVMEYVRAGR